MRTTKLILLCIFVAVGQLTNAQLKLPFDSITKLVSYSEIVYVDSTVTKKELNDRAFKWIESRSNSNPTGLILTKDDGEKVSLKGSFNRKLSLGLTTNDITVYYYMNISFKDGRCKVQITNLNYRYCWGAARGGGGSLGDPGCREETFEKKIRDLGKGDMFKEDWIDFFRKCDTEIHTTLDFYSDFVQKPVPKDDW